MKGWIGHGHRKHLVKHESVRGIQRPGPEQAGGAFRAGKDSHTDVPRGQKHGRARVSPAPGLKCWADQLLQMPKKTVDRDLSVSDHLAGICEGCRKGPKGYHNAPPSPESPKSSEPESTRSLRPVACTVPRRGCLLTQRSPHDNP